MAAGTLAIESTNPPYTVSQGSGEFEGDQEEEFFDESVELSDDYGLGKLHPVHLGDLFKASRYKILRKLGAGSFSTVWLARDRRLQKYVALKIATARSSATEHESVILKSLSRRQLQRPGQAHVTTLQDSFEHQGPNGLHRCLIFEVMGPNSSAMFKKLPMSMKAPRNAGEQGKSGNNRLPFWMAKSVLKQLLLAIDFLHKNEIVHGDLQPGNILFSVKDLSHYRECDLAQGDPLESIFVKKINQDGEVDFQDVTAPHDGVDADFYTQSLVDDKPNPSTPRYIIPKEPLFKYVDLDPPLLVKVSDLGGAFFTSEPPAKPVTPLALRSPEFILGEPISKSQDIWSFGCLIFEFLTGRMLFSVIPPMPGAWANEAFSDDDDQISTESGGGDENGEIAAGEQKDPRETAALQDKVLAERCESDYSENDEVAPSTDDDTDDDHVLQMADLLGPVPLSFMAKFPRSSIYFNNQGNITRHYVGELTEEDDIDQILALPPIESYLEQEKGADMRSEDTAYVKELLRLTLQFDPTERATADTLLAHPWFAEPGTDI